MTSRHSTPSSTVIYHKLDINEQPIVFNIIKHKNPTATADDNNTNKHIQISIKETSNGSNKKEEDTIKNGNKTERIHIIIGEKSNVINSSSLGDNENNVNNERINNNNEDGKQ